ncbi:hypothetical protein LTR62_000881 [Meristemomyces frigidus]|uniref:Uncharacterized protein n=1 Tax=Meristemomyces frigidus TaxID=1508187 RepID=A0AAN7TL66_9PEZI|nr:hypothetical protein LTR62_000881 [Meristemomyces frigidus]
MSKVSWTDAEKLGLFFQIMEKSGTICWSELTLPEGRTMKACQVMVDKEKARVKAARLTKRNGEEPAAAEGTMVTPKKRSKKDEVGEEEGSPPKKPRKARMKKVKAEEEEEEEEEGEVAECDAFEKAGVKAEHQVDDDNNGRL